MDLLNLDAPQVRKVRTKSAKFIHMQLVKSGLERKPGRGLRRVLGLGRGLGRGLGSDVESGVGSDVGSGVVPAWTWAWAWAGAWALALVDRGTPHRRVSPPSTRAALHMQRRIAELDSGLVTPL